MATSDFLTFSAAAGANVLTQSAYADAGNTDRATGYVTGTASSQAVNKTLRQASIISAMVAQLIVDQTGQDAVDDGTIATLETNFTNAILAIAGNRIIQISDVVNLTATLASKLGVSDNAASASKLQTARAIALEGIISGSANFDGSGNISISTSIADAALSIAKTAGLQSLLNALAPINNSALTGTTTAQSMTVAGSNVVTQAGFSTTSDGNGTVTRFPDGTIIARGIMDKSKYAITFPSGINFSQPPVVTATPLNNTGNPNGYTMAVGVSTTSGAPVNQNYPLSIYWMAIGR